MYEGYKEILVSREGGVVTICLNRPEVKNATNVQMHQDLVRVFPEIGRDPEARVVVLTGAGDAFSAGGDIATLRAAVDDHVRWQESMIEARDILCGVMDLDRPVIAKVNGHAIGLGATLALFCDFVIANERARFGDPHVSVGLSAGDGGSVIWPALVGFAKAKRYLLTGDTISGAEAAEIGLITEAVPLDQLDAKVADLAAKVAGLPAVAVRLTKKSINMGLRQQVDRLIEAHLGYETMSHLSEDHREALDAILEKRSPIFTGR